MRQRQAGRHPSCTVILDRVRILSWAPNGGTWAPTIKGYRVVSDRLVCPKGQSATYGRVREYQALDSDAKISLQYQRARGFLRQWRITLVADDRLGLQPKDIAIVARQCRHYRITMMELAFDFPPTSIVDLDFVRRYALFGKSRPRRKHQRPDIQWYGTRRSAKFVRCYPKAALGVFRIELELHGQLLRAVGIDTVDDIPDLAFVLVPQHARFVTIRRRPLKRYLLARFDKQSAARLLTNAENNNRLHDSLRQLRHAGIHNVHRFLSNRWPTSELQNALAHWSARWENQSGRVQIVLV